MQDWWAEFWRAGSGRRRLRSCASLSRSRAAGLTLRSREDGAVKHQYVDLPRAPDTDLPAEVQTGSPGLVHSRYWPYLPITEQTCRLHAKQRQRQCARSKRDLSRHAVERSAPKCRLLPRAARESTDYRQGRQGFPAMSELMYPSSWWAAGNYCAQRR